MEPQSPLLLARNLHWVTPVTQQVILDHISFQLNQGDRIAIIGSSGSGKTSLLRILNRLQNPSSGSLFYQGEPYAEIPVIELRQAIVYLPQEPKLLGMTVEETLTYPLKLQKLSPQIIKTRLNHYREQFQIPKDWLTRSELQLSLGQRQLITLIRALMMKPKILLLDEPNSALDRGRSQQLSSHLKALTETEKMAILLISHQLDFIQDFAQGIHFLDQGKLSPRMNIETVDWLMIEEKLKIKPDETWDEEELSD